MFSLRYDSVVISAFAFLLLLPSVAAGKGLHQQLDLQDGKCFDHSDCPSIYFCYNMDATTPGDCRLGWWLIVIIVTVAILIVGGICACFCSPCCLLYGAGMAIWNFLSNCSDCCGSTDASDSVIVEYANPDVEEVVGGHRAVASAEV